MFASMVVYPELDENERRGYPCALQHIYTKAGKFAMVTVEKLKRYGACIRYKEGPRRRDSKNILIKAEKNSRRGSVSLSNSAASLP
jgi:hypothetical protein